MRAISRLRQRVGKVLGRSGDSERFLRRLDFPAAEVPRIYGLLESEGIRAWVTGGWGVDAIAGRQTRPHRDIDLLVPIDEGDRARRILEGHGFELYLPEVQFPYRVGLVNRRARLMVDLQLVSPRPDGSCVFRVVEKEIPSYDYVYSADGMGGKGSVAGVEIPCITAEEQRRARTEQDYSFENADRVRAGGVLADVHDLSVVESLLDP